MLVMESENNSFPSSVMSMSLQNLVASDDVGFNVCVCKNQTNFKGWLNSIAY